MLSTRLIQALTKSEIMLYNSIQNSNNYDYSIAEMMGMFNISRQTVCKSLRTLVEKHLVTKTDFFIGRIRRCRYTVENRPSTKNLTGLETETKTDETVDNGGSGIKKESQFCSTDFLKPIINTIFSVDMINDIYNIYNKSNQSDYTVFLKGCQEKVSKNSKKNLSLDKFMADMTATLSPALSNYKVTTLLQRLFKKMWQEKNDDAKKVIQFFNNEAVEEKKDLLHNVLNRFSRRVCNKTQSNIRNIGAYLRVILVNAIQEYYDAKAVINEGKDVILATNKTSKDTVIGKLNKPSWHNFEQRQYSDDYFEQFYCTCGG